MAELARVLEHLYLDRHLPLFLIRGRRFVGLQEIARQLDRLFAPKPREDRVREAVPVERGVGQVEAGEIGYGRCGTI